MNLNGANANQTDQCPVCGNPMTDMERDLAICAEDGRSIYECRETVADVVADHRANRANR